MIPAVVLAMGVLLASPSAEDVQRAAQDVYADGAYQRTLPDAAPLRADPRPFSPSADVSGITGVFEILLYVLLAVGAGLVGFWLVQALLDRRTAAAPTAPPPPPPAPALSDRPLEDAAALAGQGRYTEAVHALLLQTLGILARDRTFPPSWTSREIVRRLDLSETATQGLGDLVDAVEISFFGGRDAERDDYDRCVTSFRRLQALLAGDGA